MQNKLLALCAAALIATPCFAQEPAAEAPSADVYSKNAWSDFTAKFVTSTLDAMAAQASMMTLLDMPEQAAAVTAQAKELRNGSPPGLVETIMATRGTAAQALTAKLATPGLMLDSSRKGQFGADVDALARAIKQYDAISADLPYTKTQLRGAGNKGRTGLFIAKSIPDYTRSMKLELATAVAFAKANGIALAPDVTAAAK